MLILSSCVSEEGHSWGGPHGVCNTVHPGVSQGVTFTVIANDVQVQQFSSPNQVQVRLALHVQVKSIFDKNRLKSKSIPSPDRYWTDIDRNLNIFFQLKHLEGIIHTNFSYSSYLPGTTEGEVCSTTVSFSLGTEG